MDREPTPASTVQQSVPPALDRVIATCLAKDPADRFQTVHDLLLQLRWILEGGSAVPRLAVAARARPREQLAWAVSGILAAALLAAGSVALVHLRETSVPAEPVQFAVTPPDKTTLTTRQMALSPDGRSLALIVTAAGENVIFIRPLGSLVGQLLQGTEGASYPFWSPDSRWVGFFANGKLKKIQAGGGAPIVLCDAPSGRGGAWGRGNVIVFAPAAQQPLMKVVAAGGEVTPATTLEGNDGGHRWPFFLPDGDHFTFAAGASGASRGRLKMGSLTSSAAVSLIAVDATVGYSAGHLLFVRGRTLMAQPFDAVRLRSTADAFPVFENIQVDTVLYAAVTGTAGGVLAYSQGSTAPRTALTWMDRGGKPLGVVLQPDVYNNLSLSPDDRRLAVAIDTGVPANRDVWVIDLDRSTASRLTFDPASDGIGSWSPDATRVAINSNRRGAYDLYLQSSTQPGTEELLLESKSSKYSPSFSPDGRYLVYSATGGTATGFDLWVLPLTGDRKPVPFLTTPAAEDNPEFSPDGHWIAYSSNAANREDVYVRPFPGPGGQYQISRNGGTQPRWRADGRELFFWRSTAR